MSTFEVYSYWDTAIFYNIFLGVAHFFSNADFYDLLAIGVTMGMVFAALSSVVSGKGSPVDIAKYVLAGFLLFNILIVPKSNVTIIDKSFISQSSAPMTVTGVPTALAYLAHITSFTGEWIDKTYSAIFGMPENLQAAGTHMTRKIMLSTVLAEPRNALFLRNFSEYARECLAYDINTGYKSIDDIKNAATAWDLLGDTNNALLVTIGRKDGTNISYDIMTCGDAFTQLTNDKNAVAAELETRMATSMFPGMNEAAAKVAYGSVLTESMAAFMGGSTKTASEHFQDATAQNVFLKSMGAISGDPLSTTRASIGVDAGSDQKAELAKSFIYTITIVQLLAYAFFPIVVAMVIIAGPAGIKTLLFFVKVLFWLALLQASQIVLDNVILMNAASESLKTVSGVEAGSINAWESAGGIINGMEDQLQNALFAALALTWAMMSAGGSIGSGIATGLFSGAQTYNERTATDMAAEGRNAFGDVKWNNKQFDNEAGGSVNTRPTVYTAGAETMGPDGIKQTYAGGSYAVDHSALSNQGGPLGAAAASTVARRMEDAATNSDRRAEALSITAAEQRAQAVSHVAGYMATGNISSEFSVGKNDSTRQSTQNAFESVNTLAKKMSETYGISEQDAAKRIIGAGFDLGVSKDGFVSKVLDKVGLEASGSAGARINSEEVIAFKKDLAEGFDRIGQEGFKAIRSVSDDLTRDKTISDRIGLTQQQKDGVDTATSNAEKIELQEKQERQKAAEKRHTASLVEEVSQKFDGNLGAILNPEDYSRVQALFRQDGQQDAAYRVMEQAIEAKLRDTGQLGFGPTRFNPDTTIPVPQANTGFNAADQSEFTNAYNKSPDPTATPMAGETPNIIGAAQVVTAGNRRDMPEPESSVAPAYTLTGPNYADGSVTGAVEQKIEGKQPKATTSTSTPVDPSTNPVPQANTGRG